LILSAVFLVPVHSPDNCTVNERVYTKEQAKIGEKLYTDQCLICRDKKTFRPVLKRFEGSRSAAFLLL